MDTELKIEKGKTEVRGQVTKHPFIKKSQKHLLWTEIPIALHYVL